MTKARTEQDLRLDEERYRTLVEAIAEIVWIADAGGHLIEDQSTWQAFTGQTRKDLQGGGWLAAVHPDFREQAASAWLRAIAQGIPYETEWLVRRRDGTYRCFSVRAAPIRTEAGAVREWIGCNIDVTDQKRWEEELRQLHAEADKARTDLGKHICKMQILKNLSDTMQACDTSEEAYPFIARAAAELFPGTGGALAFPMTGVSRLLETATVWGEGLAMKVDFATEDCWALRRGGMHEPSAGTICQHFSSEPDGPYACVPLSVRGQVSGLLSVRLTEIERLDEEEKSVLAMFGNALALGLSTLQLRQTVHKPSSRAR